MTKIPFTKTHGAKNDFLLTWADEVAAADLQNLARAICDRHAGIGADGWILMHRASAGNEHVSITLYNSDGSLSEISGNGTRCVAALLVNLGIAQHEVHILTGAGPKSLRLVGSQGVSYEFEMDMGAPTYNHEEPQQDLRVGSETFDVTILNVGNPQCAVFVDDLGLDWRRIGAAIERHPQFPKRTNVSFVCPVDRNTIEVRFWERGAGETMSSGTGSTGAAFAALLRGLVDSPVRVRTVAGPLEFRVQDGKGLLVGPAELIGVGDFYARR